jgi:hypothetical protein
LTSLARSGKEDAMKVRHLIDYLKTCDADLDVWMEVDAGICPVGYIEKQTHYDGTIPPDYLLISPKT